MNGEVWLEVVKHSERILEKLTQHGFTALRCIADGETVVSAYLVAGPDNVAGAARAALPFYPHTRRLEVQGVKADVGGAVVRSIVTFTAQALPSSGGFQQDGVSA